MTKRIKKSLHVDLRCGLEALTILLCRIREGRHQHDLTFKSVAKGTISKGYLDPTDGKTKKGII